MGWTCILDEHGNEIGAVGDEAWDIMATAIVAINELYLKRFNRLPSGLEMQNIFEFTYTPRRRVDLVALDERHFKGFITVLILGPQNEMRHVKLLPAAQGLFNRNSQNDLQKLWHLYEADPDYRLSYQEG